MRRFFRLPHLILFGVVLFFSGVVVWWFMANEWAYSPLVANYIIAGCASWLIVGGLQMAFSHVWVSDETFGWGLFIRHKCRFDEVFSVHEVNVHAHRSDAASLPQSGFALMISSERDRKTRVLHLHRARQFSHFKEWYGLVEKACSVTIDRKRY